MRHLFSSLRSHRTASPLRSSSDSPSLDRPTPAPTAPSATSPPAYDRTGPPPPRLNPNELWASEREYWLAEVLRMRAEQAAETERRAARRAERERKEERRRARRERKERELEQLRQVLEIEAEEARRVRGLSEGEVGGAEEAVAAGVEPSHRQREVSAGSSNLNASEHALSSNSSTIRPIRILNQALAQPAKIHTALAPQQISTTPPATPPSLPTSPPIDHFPGAPQSPVVDPSLYSLSDDIGFPGTSPPTIEDPDFVFSSPVNGSIAPDSPYVPNLNPPDPSPSQFSKPINKSYYNHTNSIGYRSTPYATFHTIDGRFVGAGGLKEVLRELSEREWELMSAAGKVVDGRGRVGTLLSPVQSESETGSIASIERPLGRSTGGDAVAEAEAEFARAEAAYERARERLAQLRRGGLPSPNLEECATTGSAEDDIDELTDELQRILEQMPSEPPTGTRRHLLSTGRYRPLIAYLPRLTAEDKLALKRSRQVEKARGDKPSGLEPLATESGERYAVWKAYQAFQKKRQEIVSAIVGLEESEKLMLKMGGTQQDSAKLAKLYAELGRLCWNAPLASERAEGAQWIQHSAQLDPTRVDVLVDLGLYFTKVGNAAEAVELYEKASKITPNDARVWLLLGEALVQTEAGEPTPRSRDALLRATELGYDSFAGAVAWLIVGQVYEALDTPKSDMQAFEAYDSAYCNLQRSLERSKEEIEADRVKPPPVEAIMNRFKVLEAKLGVGQEEEEEDEMPTMLRRATEPVHASARMYDYDEVDFTRLEGDASTPKPTQDSTATSFHTPAETPPPDERSARATEALNLVRLIKERLEELSSLGSSALIKGSVAIAYQHLVDLSEMVRSGGDEFETLAGDLEALPKRIAAAETLRQKRPPGASAPSGGGPVEDTLGKVDALEQAILELDM